MIEYGIVKLDTEKQNKSYTWGQGKWRTILKLLFEMLGDIPVHDKESGK